MMKHKLSVLALAVMAGSILFGGAAFADNNHGRGGKSNWRSDDHKHGRYEQHNRRDNAPNRTQVRYYKIKMEPGAYRDVNRRMTTAYYDRSPSRYTRYHNVNYIIGRPLPRHTVIWDVPRDVRYSLPRPYANTQYVWVDRDIILIDQRDNTVLDIIRAVLN